MSIQNQRLGVVIPCFNVRKHILKVIADLGPEVDCIYVVDDSCPEGTGQYVKDENKDRRVTVLFNKQNLGVGGATKAGYERAIRDQIDIIIKVDGDGQMDTHLIPQLVLPLVEDRADYTKGNRFFNLKHLSKMPVTRIFGNALLSLLSKLSSGYWDLFDPTNGFTAITQQAAKNIPLDKVSNSYFFESDLLFRLNTIRAVVVDVPMDAKYGDEKSNMRVSIVAFEFFFKHLRNFGKRIFYNYYLRGMSLASIELPIGISLFFFGVCFGAIHWIQSLQTGLATPVGTVMLAAMSVLIGLQLILAFLAYDISSVPRSPMSRLLPNSSRSKGI